MGRPKKDANLADGEYLLNGGAEDADVDETSDTEGGEQSNAAPPPPSDTEAGKNQAPAKDGVRRILRPGKENKKIIAGEMIVEFDAEGVSEVDPETAEYLLSIPGYEEIA